MGYLELIYSSYSEDTSEVDPEDSWDRPNTATTYDVRGLKLVDQDGYKRLPVDDDVSVGDDLWVVYAVYSTGDTFGHDEGGGFEWLSYHRTEEAAQKAKSDDEQGSDFITLDNGKQQKFYRSWDGYFESLDSLEIKRLTVD